MREERSNFSTSISTWTAASCTPPQENSICRASARVCVSLCERLSRADFGRRILLHSDGAAPEAICELQIRAARLALFTSACDLSARAETHLSPGTLIFLSTGLAFFTTERQFFSCREQQHAHRIERVICVDVFWVGAWAPRSIEMGLLWVGWNRFSTRFGLVDVVIPWGSRMFFFLYSELYPCLNIGKV